MSKELSNKFFRNKLFIIPAVLISLGIMATPIYLLGKQAKQKEITQMLTAESQGLKEYLDKDKINFYFQGRKDSIDYSIARIHQLE